MAQDTMLVWIRPPGRKKIHLDIAEYIFSPIPLRFINSPIKMNRGTATRMKLVFDSHALFAMMFQRGASEKNHMMTRERHPRSEEHTSELQSRTNLVCRLLLEKKKKIKKTY